MIIRARTILPMNGAAPIDNGAVVVKGSRIRALGPLQDIVAHYSGTVLDLGDQVLMPGLINAHCHLDYTLLRRAIAPPRGFTAWVQRLNALKCSLEDDDYLRAIQRGFAELRKWGTTTVLNIESFPELMSRLPTPPIRAWWFYEMIDVRQRITTEDLFDGAEFFFREHTEWLGGFGLSPHAPYTASAGLYRLASACARQQKMLVTTHISESVDEAAMFHRASGPLYDFMGSIGRDMSDCGHGSPLQHLFADGLVTPDWIVAHMNDLTEEDFALLERKHVHVVHCAGSHRYFGHTQFPMDRLRSMGINISLGTDSLASCYTLSLFEEMRIVAARYPGLAPRELLEMVTINPAAALQKTGDLGVIAPKAKADFIALPINGGPDLLEQIIWHRAPVDWMMVNGRVLPTLAA